MNFDIIKFRSSMLLSLTLIIGASTLVFFIILSLIGISSILLLGILVVGFNIAQWLFGPKIIDHIYKTKEAGAGEYQQIHDIIKRISDKANINEPKLVIAEVNMPNAFAYGSPLTGSKVAITRGLLSTLNIDEIEAVLGHELGHLKHRDVQVMMLVSMLPAILYYISFSMFFGSMFNSRQNNGIMVIIAIISFLGYILLTVLTLWFSRMRESYADRHSVEVVKNGAKKLTTALAKIYISSYQLRGKKSQKANSNAFKSLFIIDPSTTSQEDINKLTEEELVNSVVNRRLGLMDKIEEILSTHPNIIKRIRTLQKLSEQNQTNV